LSFFTAHEEVCIKLDALDREPVTAKLVFNLSSKFHRKISADSFFLSFEISAYSNGCHLGSKIISAQVTEQNILRRFFPPQNMQYRLKEKFNRKLRNIR
jgi:hypothetical protein